MLVVMWNDFRHCVINHTSFGGTRLPDLISSGWFQNTNPFDIIKLILTIYFADFYFILMSSIFHLHVLKMRQYSHRLHIKYSLIKSSEKIVTGGVLSSSSACFSEWLHITLSMTMLLLRLCQWLISHQLNRISYHRPLFKPSKQESDLSRSEPPSFCFRRPHIHTHVSPRTHTEEGSG